MRDLELAALTRDIAEHGLHQGDVGTIVHVHRGGAAYEVEFTTGAGRTVAVLTMDANDVRPVRGDEILHARSLVDEVVQVVTGEQSQRR
jgi:hypothetical protein